MKFWQGSLRTRLIVLLLLITIVPLLVISFIAYETGRQGIVEDTEAHLSSVAALKEREITNWMEHLEHAINWIASSSQVMKHSSILVTKEKDSPEYSSAHTALVDEFKRTAGLQHLSPVFLLDPDSGRIIASSHQRWEGQFRKAKTWFARGKSGTYVSKFFHSLTLTRPTLVIAAPITDSSGQLIAVIAGHANLEPLNEIMMEQTGLGETGESYLVNRSNLLLTKSQFISGAPYEKWISTYGINQALAGKSGVSLYKGYRDKKVIGAYRWLKDLKVALVAEIDQSEAFSPVATIRITVIGVGLGLVILVALLGIMLARSITKPVDQLVLGTEELGQGNLDYVIEVETKDELGQLAEAFNSMTENLKEVTASRDELEREIAQRKRTEEELRKKELAIQSSLSAIAITDKDGLINYVNPSFLNLWGYQDREEVLGKPAIEFWQNKEKAQKVMKEVEKSGDWSGELIAKRKDDSIFHAEATASIVTDSGGDPIGLMSSFRDITDRVRAQERLKETLSDLARSNEELKQFAYVASHELQEPLRMVSSYTKLLEKRYKNELDEDAREFINYAADGAERMQKQINALLHYSRITTKGKELKTTDTVSALAKARDNLKKMIEENQAKVTNDELPKVQADESQLVRLFQNLVQNAIKFRGKETPNVHISAEEREDDWLFAVTDNGKGIEPEYQEEIFSIFKRLEGRDETEGTGIGLASCKKIVERHGGDIWVESELGEGSTFYFTLPKSGGENNE
ncbi:PAS domain S-box protein [Candidatus Bipolaricaulota bacterium]|nr:PAS domain S-box protein [Candidatus Bipolaricaulota bacterium]